LLEQVKKMKHFKIDNAQSVRNFLVKKGIRLFFDLSDNLNAYRKNFSEEKTINNKRAKYLKQVNGEKFNVSPPDQLNYREWEQYDLIDVQAQPHIDLQAQNLPDGIEMALIPGYIRDDISLEKNPELNLTRIQSCKSGVKVGSQIRNTNVRWIEKWFELSCKDQRVKSSKQVEVVGQTNMIEQQPQDVIIRYYSKMWTLPEGGKMQGESCMAVLIDGKMHNVQDGLAYELHEKFTCDNILKR